MIALLHLTAGRTNHRRDPFEPSRRVEQAYAPDVLPLAEVVPGYERNREAATVTLNWLEKRFAVVPVVVGIAVASVSPLWRSPFSCPAAASVQVTSSALIVVRVITPPEQLHSATIMSYSEVSCNLQPIRKRANGPDSAEGPAADR
ncbi:hypothetical protein GCM10010149_15910 [Nonomuraea roseoviolacea subsp. roseoviolacea]|uniref:hypothetical protein n=1 Tax=Nonomuraea roseoviolacea TaxID=103837 RepID=UPI0031D010F1